MEEYTIKWSDDFNCGHQQIDAAHKSIITKTGKLLDMIRHKHHSEKEMLDLADEIRIEFLKHMAFEIELLQKISEKDAEEHEASHSFYKTKFDLECKHSMSEMMRVLMVAEMVKECVQNHIEAYDLKSFKSKIQAHKGHNP